MVQVHPILSKLPVNSRTVGQLWHRSTVLNIIAFNQIQQLQHFRRKYYHCFSKFNLHHNFPRSVELNSSAASSKYFTTSIQRNTQNFEDLKVDNNNDENKLKNKKISKNLNKSDYDEEIERDENAFGSWVLPNFQKEPIRQSDKKSTISAPTRKQLEPLGNIMNLLDKFIHSDEDGTVLISNNKLTGQLKAFRAPSLYTIKQVNNKDLMILMNEIEHYEQGDPNSHIFLTLFGQGTTSKEAIFLLWLLLYNYKKNSNIKVTVIDGLSKLLSNGFIKETIYAILIMFDLKLIKSIVLQSIKERQNLANTTTAIHSDTESIIDSYETTIYNLLSKIVPKSGLGAALTERDTQPISELLIHICISEGLPLLASSICIKLGSEGMVQQSTLSAVIAALLVSNPKMDKHHLEALMALDQENFPVTLSKIQRKEVMEIALNIVNEHFPKTANVIFNFLNKKLGEGEVQAVPVKQVYKLMMQNKRNHNVSGMWLQWNKIKSYYPDISFHDPGILSALIGELSKSKAYRDSAKTIVDQLPLSLYTHPGMSEALLIYAARQKDVEFASVVCQQLTLPLSRNVLGALLYLHLSFDDSEGAERVLSEIFRQGSTLQSSEFGMLTRSLLQKDQLEQAIALSKSVDPVIEITGLTHIVQYLLEKHKDIYFIKIPMNERVLMREMVLKISKSEIRKERDNITVMLLNDLARRRGCISAQLFYNYILIPGNQHKLKDLKSIERKISKTVEFYEYSKYNLNISTSERIFAIKVIGDFALSEKNREIFLWSAKQLNKLGLTKNQISFDWVKRFTKEIIESRVSDSKSKEDQNKHKTKDDKNDNDNNKI